MFYDLLDWLYNTSYAEMMRDSLWGYPIGETVHLLGITLLFGSILLADLRFIGVGRHIGAGALTSGYLLRVTWIGFALIVLSGLSLFAAYAIDTINSPIFVAKMVLIAVAGVNMLFFTFRVTSGMHLWESDVTPPTAARVSAGLSIALWTLTIFAGRLIAYPEIFETAS
ncbi:MAG TPA: hypothetical protein PK680_05815 [Novosphingobium sp.]|nr:hypothetical protein [Novosphingobium sp.]HQA17884.1 hypothetical protein [Novosphingobium sp.]